MSTDTVKRTDEPRDGTSVKKVLVRMPLYEYEALREHAKQDKESMNSFCRRAISLLCLATDDTNE